MCRNIKRLRTAERTAAESEIYDAALQFVRKISGFRAPSKANSEIFYHSVKEIAEVSSRLLDELTIQTKPAGSQLAAE